MNKRTELTPSIDTALEKQSVISRNLLMAQVALITVAATATPQIFGLFRKKSKNHEDRNNLPEPKDNNEPSQVIEEKISDHMKVWRLVENLHFLDHFDEADMHGKILVNRKTGQVLAAFSEGVTFDLGIARSESELEQMIEKFAIEFNQSHHKRSFRYALAEQREKFRNANKKKSL